MNRDFVVAFLRCIGLAMLSLVGLAVFTATSTATPTATQTATATGGPTPTISPSAHATPTPAELSWSPSPFDFGSVVPPATATETFTLFNAGGMSSGTIAVTLSGSSAFVITADGCTDRALAPKKSCGVTVEYEPTTTTGNTGTLTATAEKASTFENLTGNGPTPDLVLDRGTFLETLNGTNFYDASSVLISGVPQQFNVSNIGTGISEVLTTELSSNGPFEVTNETCRQEELAPGDTCFFFLTFTLPNGCTSGTVYHAVFEVLGISSFPFVTYVDLVATETCP